MQGCRAVVMKDEMQSDAVLQGDPVLQGDAVLQGDTG